MASAPPPPLIGKSGNLTIFITPPPAEPPPSPGPENPGSEFSTPPTSPRAGDLPPSPEPSPPASPLSLPPVRTASPPPLPDDAVSTPTLVRTVSPPLPPPKIARPPPSLVETVSPPLPPVKLAHAPPPPVQVPPPQYEKASARPDGSVLTLFWDAVARVQEAHLSLDEYISKWFGLDQSKYQWALNDYHERTGQMDSVKGGNPKEFDCKIEKV